MSLFTRYRTRRHVFPETRHDQCVARGEGYFSQVWPQGKGEKFEPDHPSPRALKEIVREKAKDWEQVKRKASWEKEELRANPSSHLLLPPHRSMPLKFVR